MVQTEARLPSGLRGFFGGVLCVFMGLKRVLEDGVMRRHAAAPLLISAVLYLVLAGVLISVSPALLGMVWGRPAEGVALFFWYLMVPVLIALGLVMMALLFGTVAEAIGGPFWDRMAMRVLAERGISAREPGLWAGTLPDIARSLLFLFAAGLCAALSVIPVVGVVFAVLGTVIAWVGLAAAAINPALMCTGLDLPQRLRFVFRSLGALAGVGLVVGLAMMVPLLGLIAIPSAVVGATEMYARAASASPV